MGYLLLQILFSLAFVQLFKWGQRRGDDGMTLVVSNYAFGALLALGVSAAAARGEAPSALVPVGMLAGATYVASLGALNLALRRASVAPALLSFRLAIVIPFFASLAWGDSASPLQFAGLALSLAALPFLAPSGGGAKAALSALGLLALVFLAESAAKASIRFAAYKGIGGAWTWRYVAVVYATAAALGIAWLASRRTLRLRSVPLGMLIGLVNLGATGFALLAVGAVGGPVFFPVTALATVILDVLLAIFLWREPPDRRTWIGIALGTAAIALVSAG